MPESKAKPVAVVTGVGPGLGASLARRFASEYAVAIIARRVDYLHSLATEIRGTGATVLDVPADIGVRAEVEAAFKTIRAELGAPEVLLYNAGGGTWGTIAEVTPEQYEAS
jgi:NAD(P)-dependent dehydrogenase (short-subunit alcohol dehydrogenase family)